MNKIDDDLTQGNSMAKPILTLKLKYDFDGYTTSIKTVWRDRYNKKILKYYKIYIVFCIFLILALVVDYIIRSRNDIYWSPRFIIVAIFVCSLLIILNIEYWYSYKHEKIYFFNHIIKRQSLIFKDKTLEEIKKITIQNTLCFYDTHLIKATPSIEEVKSVSPEEIINLSPDKLTKLEYNTKFFKIRENEECISLYPGVYILKKWLSDQDKEKIEIVKEKIKLA